MQQGFCTDELIQGQAISRHFSLQRQQLRDEMPLFKAILEYSTGMQGWLLEPFLVVLTRPSSWGRHEAKVHAKAEQQYQHYLEDVPPSAKTLASVPLHTASLRFLRCQPSVCKSLWSTTPAA